MEQIRAGRREWIGVGVLVLPALLVSMDLTVLFFALPFIAADLQPSATQTLWILDIYGFVLAGLLITMGSLGDRIGRRRLLVIGAVAFGVASIIAAWSTSPEMLLAARVLLGVGGATLAPSTLSLLRNMFQDPGERRKAIGIWTAGFGGGSFLGPIVGGFLLEQFWWGSVFLVNVPVMVLLVVAAPIVLPEFRDATAGRMDLASAALSLLAILPVIYGIKELATHGFDPLPVAVITVGIIFGVMFAHRQRRLVDPMLDLALFGKRAFSVSIGVGALTVFALSGLGLYSAQFFQLVLGMGPMEAAWWSLPSFIGLPVGIALATGGAGRLRTAYVVGAGLLLMAAGFLILTQLAVDSSPWLAVLGSGVMVTGVGAVFALATDLAIAAAPPERAGGAGATSETANEFGGALGIALLGSVGAAIYRRFVKDRPVDGLPAEAAGPARESLAVAVEVARSLPADAGNALVAVAREGFMEGFNAVTLIGAGALVLAAILAMALLRGLTPDAMAEGSAGSTTSGD